MLEGCRDCVRLFVCVSLCPSVLLVSAWMFLHMCPYLDIVCVYVSLCVSVCAFLSVRICMYGCMCVGLFMLHQSGANVRCRVVGPFMCQSVMWRGGGGSLAVFPFLAVGCESAGRRLGLRQRSFSRRRREEARAALHHADTQTARTGGENIGAPSSPVCPPPPAVYCLFVYLSTGELIESTRHFDLTS